MGLHKLSKALLLVLAPLCVQAAEPAKPVVNLYIWGEYLAPDTLKNFEAKTGIQVVADHFDSLETVETKLLTGRSGYDLVLTAGQHLSRAIESGAIQTLNKQQLPHFAGVGDEFRQHMAVFDPGNRYAGIYAWGTTGVGYQEEAVKQRLPEAPRDSWAMLFDPAVVSKFADCGVSLLNDPNEVFAAVMKYMGLDINRQSLDDLKLAELQLAKIRPYIRYFDNDLNISDLANGNICVAVGFSGDILQAESRAREAKNGVEIGYSIPREGSPIWFDMVAMPVDAPDEQAGYAFMNYLLRPDVMAGISNYVHYANGNEQADSLIDPAIKNDTKVYPSPEMMGKLFALEAMPLNIDRIRTRVWNKIRTGS